MERQRGRQDRTGQDKSVGGSGMHCDDLVVSCSVSAKATRVIQLVVALKNCPSAMWSCGLSSDEGFVTPPPIFPMPSTTSQHLTFISPMIFGAAFWASSGVLKKRSIWL